MPELSIHNTVVTGVGRMSRLAGDLITLWVILFFVAAVIIYALDRMDK